MKIEGPGQPPTPAPEGVGKSNSKTDTKTDVAADPARAGSAAGEVSDARRAFAERMAQSTPTGEASKTAEASRSAPSGPVEVRDLAAEVEAGRLDPRAAVDQLIDRVVDVQVGLDAPAAVRDRIQAALRDALESDPLLAAKLSQLG